MKFKKLGKKITAMGLVAAQVFAALQLGSMDAEAAASMTQEECKDIVSTYSVTDSVPGYVEYLAEHADAATPDQTIEINAADYVSYLEDDKEVAPEIFSNYEGMTGDSVLTAENGYIEYEFEVPTAGFYDLSLLYYPVEGKNSEIQRSFFIDGKLPYGEVSLVEFSRIWSTDVAQENFGAGISEVVWEADNQGNDMKPTSIEIPEWTTANLYDNNG